MALGHAALGPFVGTEFLMGSLVGRNEKRAEKPVITDVLAEGVGFEPTKAVKPCRFSRPVHSTALPALRGERLYRETVGLLQWWRHRARP